MNATNGWLVQRGPVVPGAVLDAARGVSSAVVISGRHRLSYTTTDRLYQSVELEKQIQRLQGAVGNAVERDKHLVFGTGFMQLVNALEHALSPDGAAGPRGRHGPVLPGQCISLMHLTILHENGSKRVEL